MNFISDFKNLIIVAVLSLIVGFGAGFYTKTKFYKADQADTVVEAHKETAQNILQAQKTDKTVEQKVEKSKQNISAIRKTVAERLQPIQPKETHDVPPAETNTARLKSSATCSRGDWTLDLGIARLLDDARTETTPDAAFLGDAASQTPSDITAPQLIDNDLEVVQLYHELAKRHDALVDYVEGLVKDQAK